MLLLTLAGLAARVATTDPRQHTSFVGGAFATLPTQAKTGYPVHVNARWCLNDNRTRLVADDSHSNRPRAKWNAALIEDAVASLWAELLVELRGREPPLPNASYYALFPTSATLQGE